MNSTVTDRFRALAESTKTHAVFRRLVDVPWNSKIVIYGPNSVGQNLYHSLRRYRPDIDVVAFIDTFRRGNFDNKPIVRLDDFKRSEFEFDHILITMLGRLEQVLPNLQGIRKEKIGICFASTFNLFGTRAPAHIDDWHVRVAKIRAALADDRDRTVWDVLTDGMSTQSLYGLAEYIVANNVPAETYLEHATIGQGSVVIEGGPFDGATTLTFAEHVGHTGRVYAFEPVPPSSLGDNLAAQPRLARRIEVMAEALWARSGTLYFSEDAAASHVAADGTGIPVRAVSIDDFAASIDRLDLIKLDVEGAELPILSGATETIIRFRPQIAVTIYHGFDQFVLVPEYLVDLLKKYHYRFHITAHHVISIDVILHCIPESRPLE